MALPLLIALDTLGGTIGKLTSAMKQSIAFAEQSQKASLGLGMTFAQARDRLGTSMDQLRGSIEQRFTAGMIALDAGLRNNATGVMQLVNQQKLTGTYTAKTAQVFARLENVMGMNNEQMNKLAVELPTLGNTFGITSDKLVEAISSLEKDFAQFNILGTEALPGAIAQLQAEVGASFSASKLQQVVGLLTDTTSEGLRRLVVLGLGDFRERLQAVGNDQAATTKLLKEGVKTAADQLDRLYGGANKTSISLDAWDKVLGRNARELILFNNALENNNKIQNKQSVDFTEQLSVMMSEVFNPFKEIVFELYSTSMPGLVVLFQKLTDTVRDAAESLKKSFVGKGGFEGIFLGLKATFLEANIAMQEFFYFLRTLEIPGMGYVFNRDVDTAQAIREGLLPKHIGYDMNMMNQFMYTAGPNAGKILTGRRGSFNAGGPEDDPVFEKLVEGLQEQADKQYLASVESGGLKIATLKQSLVEALADHEAAIKSKEGKTFADVMREDEELLRAQLGLQRESNELQRQLLDQAQQQTSPSFLNESALLVGESVAAILGFNPETGGRTSEEVMGDVADGVSQVAGAIREAFGGSPLFRMEGN